MKRYSAAEIKFISENYKQHNDALIIAKCTDRNVGAIRQKISKMRLSISLKIKFTPADNLFLKENYLRYTNAQLAKHLGRKLTITRMQLHKLGLCRVKYTPWSDREKEILKSNYKHTGDTELISLLPGRSKQMIRKQRIILQCLRSKEEIKNILINNYPKMQAHQFKPGEQKYKPDHKKIWETRRKNARLTHEKIIEKIDRREKHGNSIK